MKRLLDGVNHPFQLFLYSYIFVCTVVDDEIGEASVLLWLLHLHPCSDLCLGCFVTLHCPLETDTLGGIDEEDIINVFAEPALVKNGTLQCDKRLVLLLCPECEILQYSRMNDGVHLLCVFGVGKEVVGEALLVESRAVKDIRADELNELATYIFVQSREPFGLLVAVIDRHAKLLGQDSRDIALAATYAARDAYRAFAICHQLIYIEGSASFGSLHLSLFY